jgi:hypothetical protein
MASLGGFNAGDHDTSQRSSIPLGIYLLEVEASDVVPTKAGTGQQLTATINVIQPDEFAGRKIFHRMNIANDNPKAEKIGKEELARMIRAMGEGVNPAPEDTEELHFHSFLAKVGFEKPTAEYPDPRNKIVLYYYPDEATDEKPLPEPGLLDEPPAAKGKPAAPANDNRKPAANNNAPAAKPAAKGSNPWSKK